MRFQLNRSLEIVFALLSITALVLFSDCRMRRYSNDELRKHETFEFPPVYDTLIAPLHEQIIPISKRLFFLKLDREELKDRLWDGGSNQRVMRIDTRIDTLNHEMFLLSGIRRELINTILFLYPAYQTPQIVPYTGKNKKYETFTKPILLITTEDQREYEQAKSNGEIMSEELDHKPIIETVMRKYSRLPDSLKRPIAAIGTPGAVPPIPPYTPPPLPRKRVKYVASDAGGAAPR